MAETIIQKVMDGASEQTRAWVLQQLRRSEAETEKTKARLREELEEATDALNRIQQAIVDLS